MATISERLRRGEEKYRSDRSIVYKGSTALGREAADTIDALVAIAERAWQIAGDQFRDEIEDALARAKG